ncbi:NAD(P)H-dependent oxidoreductase [bacterium]|nr:NAD(P)H-dependent oxidoreductase [bacterium]
MRRCLFVSTILFLAPFFSACQQETKVSQAKAEPAAETAKTQKILVAVYSWSGNTRHAAEIIAKTARAELFEIVPKEAYPEDYKECINKAKEDIANGVKPELTSLPENIASYDIIFVGTPNWWSTIAPPVKTFLDCLKDYKGLVVPFVTHGSGGLANCEKDIRSAVPNVKVSTAGSWPGRSIDKADDAIAEWTKSVIGK